VKDEGEGEEKRRRGEGEKRRGGEGEKGRRRAK